MTDRDKVKALNVWQLTAVSAVSGLPEFSEKHRDRDIGLQPFNWR